MTLKKLSWQQVSILAPRWWNAYDAETGVWVATLQGHVGGVMARFVEGGYQRETFKNVNFAKLWVEKQYAKQEA